MSRLTHALCKGCYSVASCAVALLPCPGECRPDTEGRDVEDQERIEEVRKMRQGKPPMTFKEIADVLGCTRPEAAQLARKAQGIVPEPQTGTKKNPYEIVGAFASMMRLFSLLTCIGACIAAAVAIDKFTGSIGPNLPAMGYAVATAAVITGVIQALIFYAIGEGATLLVGIHQGVLKLLAHDGLEQRSDNG